MASPSMADIKALRERTGAGILDCKRALSETDSIEAAIDWLRAKGIAKAAKKAGRAATEGLVHAYIHGTGRIGVMVEVNCETDFAAMNDQFKNLVQDLAMHIAAAAPEYVSIDDIPAEDIAKEREVQKARVMEEGKPEHIADKIVTGRLNKWYKDVVLMEQQFVKDDSKTIREVLQDAVSTIGENIQFRRFTRFVLGEGLEKKEDDFAAEVAKMSS
ncbi:MAG: translation elongation factor Ts [Myxococcota bacterium]